MANRWCELTGPLAAHASGFRAELRRQGYRWWSERRQLQLLAAVDGWLVREGVGLDVLASERMEAFFAERRAVGYRNLRTVRSLDPLIGYLRRVGAVAQVADAARASGLLGRFERYLTAERGLAAGTVRFYVRIAGLVVAGRGTAGVDGLTAREAATLTAEVCAGRGLSSKRQAMSALRSFLRFLHLDGHTDVALGAAVWSVKGSAPLLPRAIDPSLVGRMLATCDRRTGRGRRDYAILMVLARLGLRAGEVTNLTLDDIDWCAGELCVSGKGGRRDRLPLPADVGAAIAGYLRRGRPRSDDRRVFLRCVAPVRGLAGAGAVSAIVARACRMADIEVVSAHRLRHTLATEMLRAGGSLAEIGQVLRHRHTATTARYAAVDHTRLAELARPWPGVSR